MSRAGHSTFPVVLAFWLAACVPFAHAQNNQLYQQQMQRQMEMQRQQDQMRQQEQMRRQQEQMQRQQDEMRRRQQEAMQRQQEEMRRRQQETMARQQDEVRRRQQQELMNRQQADRQHQDALRRQTQGQQQTRPSQSQTAIQGRPNMPRVTLNGKNNSNAQDAAGARNVRIARPLTPGEIRKGFTGRTTADGKAIVRYKGGVILVPASRVPGLAVKPANQSAQAQVASHNRAQKATELAIRARLALAGGGKPPRGPKAANDNVESRAAYKKFFRKSDVPLEAYFGHRSGVDFSKPAQVRKLVADPKNPVMVCQYQAPGRSTGSYFAPCGQTPTSLGISPRGNLSGSDKVATTKFVRKFIVVKDIDVFESTAKGVVDDKSVKGEKYLTKGGGTQYFLGRKDWQKYLKQAE